MINRRNFLMSTGAGLLLANKLTFAKDDFLKNQNNNQIFIPEMGQGFDSIYNELETDIFKPTPLPVTFPPNSNDNDNFSFQLATTQEEFTRITSMSASAKGSYGLGKVKGSGSVKKFFNSTNYSCSLIGFFRKTAAPYEASNIRINPQIIEFVKKNVRDKNLQKIERKLGDSVITGINLAAEIMVVARFDAESETKKKEIKASLNGSYGNFVSGSAKFAEFVQSAKSFSRSSISVIGHLPDSSQVAPVTLENLISIITNFNSTYKEKLRIYSYRIKEINKLPQFLNYDFIDRSDLMLRREFATELDSFYQSYEDWLADINYVNSFPTEFSQGVIDDAKRDKEKCLNGIDELKQIDRNALDAWEKGVNWKDKFSLSLLQKFLVEFPTYKQKETPIPPPKKKKRPKRESSRNDNHGEAGANRF